MKTDVLIIGGGVIGCGIAHQLCKYNFDIMLVEKEADVCMGTSKANSSMLHDGYNVDKTKLKGQLVLKSTKELYQKMAEELHFDLNICGSLLPGFVEADWDAIYHQFQMSAENDIRGVRIVGQKELHELEPHMNPAAKFALFNPNTGVLNPFELTIALGEHAVQNGAKVLLNTEVTGINSSGGRVTSVVTDRGIIEAKVVINAAGLFSDHVAGMVETIDYTVKPRKGVYFLYDKQYGTYIKRAIYSTPTTVSKGLIMLPTTEGNLLCGSNAIMHDEKDDLSTDLESLNHIYAEAIHKYYPELPRMGDVTTIFAGNRAASNTEDFIIGHSKNVRGMINLIGIQSPGLSSVPAIADMVEDLVREVGENLNFGIKDYYNPTRPKPIVLRELSYQERADYIAENPDYGTIICRCETVSKGEILDAIRRPIPATDLDAIKRRTRAGMGRCQGGFCGPRVVGILEKELGISPLEVTKKGKDSYILSMQAKELALQEGGSSNEKVIL
ncbi:MAG: NAD(P)/FAD-dependent oxidoreductase [Hespellia sp.]|nr:NAD(P)/FAD-dependent oxidoreductase [Hespellia sp.]